MADTTDKKLNSLLSSEDIEHLESLADDSSGYFGRMLEFLENFVDQGVQQGRFTEQQAREDLQLALWYAYACNNIDRYECYYKAAQWMPASESNANGCGTWYYRYAVALMYCGRLEDALRYAEKGAAEEPSYPWIWLELGRLRSHFGDKEGALAAARRGLELVPGDYEFTTLLGEIEAGASIEQMEYHWINPQADAQLLAGLDRDADEKMQAVSCIALNEAGLARFKEIFQPQDWNTDGPYRSFYYQTQLQEAELVFMMNEAGISKLKPEFLQQLKGWIDGGRLLRHRAGAEQEGVLAAVFVGLDCSVRLLYGLEDGRFYWRWLDADGVPYDDISELN